eukprot:SAG31_NODE_22_length_33849_cov_13.713096_26_plen_268_part_00
MIPYEPAQKLQLPHTHVGQGGFREPGIVRWPGKIQPGQASHAIVSTLDIHPTILAVAGIPLPLDRVFDGIDISAVLFNKNRPSDNGVTRADRDAGHACYFMYRAAAFVNASEELYAVRCGDHKVYWRTWGVAPPSQSTCGRAGTGGIASGSAYVCDPPLMFDLGADPGENIPMLSSSVAYKTAMATIMAAKTAHLASLEPCVDQNGRGSSPQYALCGDPHSKSKPSTAKWPRCTSDPENWQPKTICESTACLKANPGFRASCNISSK